MVRANNQLFCKVTILSLIFFSIVNIAIAQKNHFSISIIGIGSENYLLKGNNYLNRHLESAFLVNPGLEVIYSRDISDLFTLNTGISYQYRQYRIDSYDIYYRFGEVALPLVTTLHLIKEHALKVDYSLGIYCNQLIHIQWYENLSPGWLDGNEIVYGGLNPTKFGVDLYSNIEFSYSMRNGRNIFIAPFWMYHFIKKNYYEGMTMSSFGLKIGFMFNSF